MSRRALAAVLVLALCGCPEETSLPPPVVTPPKLLPVQAVAVAELVSVQGTVQLERDGGVGPARPAPLFEGDVVVTGPASSALLRDPGGREVELGEETRFRLGEKLASVELLAGDIQFLEGDGGSGWSNLSVRTPGGNATLRDGAAGSLKVVDGGLMAEVTFGFMDFEVQDAGTRTAAPGTKLVLGSLTFAEPEPAPATPEVAPVAFVVEVGRALLTRPGEKRPTPAKSKESAAPGTAFTVPPGASARLEGRHLRVTLGPGTSGISEGERVEGGQTAVEVTRLTGPVTLQFDGKAPTALSAGDLTITSGAESTVVVTQQGKKRRVEVRAGEASITTKDGPVTVKANEAVLVDGGKATASPGPRPALQVSGTRVRVHGDVKEVGLVLPEESNRVELAKDADFSAPFVKGTVGRQVVVPAGRGTVHYRVLDGGGAPSKQGRIDFLKDEASARDTATRSDTVAETGKKATVFYQSKVPALTFVFTPQPEAKGWRFQLLREKDLQPVVERRAQEPKLILEPGILTEGDFVWSATPLDGNGSARATGPMNKLSVVYDNARSSLLIERPLNGERAAADTRAIGVAPRASQVFLNGKLIKPDDAGRFSVPVGAVETVVFRVVSGDGESFWVRRLRR